MRKELPPLRGSVMQNNVSVRMGNGESSGVGFLARLGLLAGLLLLGLIVVAWLWHVGWVQTKAKQTLQATIHLTQKADFEVKDIIVEGRNQSSKDEIYDAIGVERGAPILSLDTKKAAERLGKLPWVASATVERRLPDTIAVYLTERKPAARWQHDDHFFVVDRKGQVLSAAKADDFSSLPLIVGAGAEREAQGLFASLKKYPDIHDKVTSAVRVGERRWDLHLQPHVTIRMPEQDLDGALHRLSVLISQQKILDRDVVAIDLRLPDRLVIEPAANPAQNGAPPS